MSKRISVPEGKSVFFRRPDVTAIEEASSRRGAAGKPATRQSAIFLEERHLDWLDDKCREARRNGGKAIRKAAIIRALLDVGMESNIDLTSLRDEDDLLERMRIGMRR